MLQLLPTVASSRICARCQIRVPSPMTASTATSAVSAMVRMALLLINESAVGSGAGSVSGSSAACGGLARAGCVRMIRTAAAPSRAPSELFRTSPRLAWRWLNARYCTVSIAAEVSAPPTAASHHRRVGRMRATITPKGTKRSTLAAPSTCMYAMPAVRGWPRTASMTSLRTPARGRSTGVGQTPTNARPTRYRARAVRSSPLRVFGFIVVVLLPGSHGIRVFTACPGLPAAGPPHTAAALR